MSIVLVVTAAIAATIEGVLPHGALLILICVCLAPALVVDILVLRGPRNRKEGAHDPLARRRKEHAGHRPWL